MHATNHTAPITFAAVSIAALSLIGCATPNYTAEYELWWDTTTTVAEEFTPEQTDTLYHAITDVMREHGRDSSLTRDINPKYPIYSVQHLDPYSEVYNVQNRRTTAISDPHFYNDNPYGFVLERTENGARIVDIHRSRRFKIPLHCGQIIYSIAGAKIAMLSDDQLALSLYRAATHGTHFVVGNRQYTRDIVLPIIPHFEPRFITATMLDDTTGYLRFNLFVDNIDNWVELATNNLLEHGMKTMIIDLRDNHGGLVNSCFNTMKLFMLNTGNYAVRCGSQTDVDYFKHYPWPTPFSDLPLIVLTNRNTASAAEIFAGTMQDRDRAIIVGEQTYGKAMVVSEFELPYNKLLWLTTGWIHLPSGRCYELPYQGSQRCYSRLSVLSMSDNFDHHFEENNANYDVQSFTSQYLHRNLFNDLAIVPDYLVPATDAHETIAEQSATGLSAWLAYEYAARIMSSNERDSLTTVFTADGFDSNYMVPNDLMKQIFRVKDFFHLDGDVATINSLETEIDQAFRDELRDEFFGMRRFSAAHLLHDPVVLVGLQHRAIAASLVK